MDAGSTFLARDNAPPAASITPAPSLSWEPSPAARLLAEIVTRNDDRPPTIRARIEAVEPSAIANEVRATIERSGMSYHAQLAQAVSAGEPLPATAAPAPSAHPFDGAAMLAMTGQLNVRIQTPIGDAAVVFHRTEDDPDTRNAGYNGKITSASIAVDHPELGAIIAHLQLAGKELVASVRCNASSTAAVEAGAPGLVRALWEIGMLPTINVTPLSHD
jgi:hypothetical protein